MSLYRRVARSFRLGKEKFFVGNDLEGNSFYERPPPEEGDWRHAKRTVEYLVSRPLSEYRFHSLPVQWNAWMRRTRKDPPTMEELETDYMRQLRLASNVERLAIEYKLEKLRALEPPVAPSATLAAPGQGATTLPTSFPPPNPEGLPTLELGSDGVKLGVDEDAAAKAAAEGEREKAMLRREFAKQNAKPVGGNPDVNYKPDTWSPAPKRR